MRPSTELLLRDLHARLMLLPKPERREAILCLRRLFVEVEPLYVRATAEVEHRLSGG